MTYIFLIASVLLGVFLASFLKPNTKTLRLFLSFSGAYLLSIIVLHLLPEVYESNSKNIGLYILLGIVLQTILEYFSEGAEHGHMHGFHFTYKVPWLLFLSLFIHAFVEGIPLGFAGNKNLLWAIVIHKIPVTFILVVFLRNSNLTKFTIYLFVLIFAIMSPMGSYIANKLPEIQYFQTQITALIIGVLLHISTAILFESSENHKFNMKKFIAILVGFLIAFFSV